MATTQTPIMVPPGVLVKRNGNGIQPVWVKLEFILGGVPKRLASHRVELIGGVINPVELIQYNADPFRQWSDLRLPSGNRVSLPNNKIRFHSNQNQDETRAARGILERVKAEIHAQELRSTQQKQAYHNYNGGKRSIAIAARGRPR